MILFIVPLLALFAAFFLTTFFFSSVFSLQRLIQPQLTTHSYKTMSTTEVKSVGKKVLHRCPASPNNHAHAFFSLVYCRCWLSVQPANWVDDWYRQPSYLTHCISECICRKQTNSNSLSFFFSLVPFLQVIQSLAAGFTTSVFVRNSESFTKAIGSDVAAKYVQYYCKYSDGVESQSASFKRSNAFSCLYLGRVNIIVGDALDQKQVLVAVTGQVPSTSML